MPCCPALLHRRPFEGGERALAPFNCLLGLTSLAEHASGVVLSLNDALAATCTAALGCPRPRYANLNAVAARSLAAVLLPAAQREAPDVAVSGSSVATAAGGRGRPHRPAWDSSPAEPPAPQRPAPAAPSSAWDGTFGGGSRWDDEPAAAPAGGGFDGLVDACDRLCSRPGYRLLSLRCGPTVPAGSQAFTPFTWPGVLAGLKQAQLAGTAADALGGSSGGRRGGNAALASLLVLRGPGAAAADLAPFGDASLFNSAQRHPRQLAVAASDTRLGGQQMLGALLSNDQVR